ncbi:MAG: GntR family transcriptional regulator [Anaerolineae bacterium]
MLLKPGPVPKYYQLSEILRARILSGELEPDQQLPTEEALCRQYGVSRGTVRQAISTLVQEGLIRREQGRGTFINRPRPGPAFFTLTSFDEDMRQQHRHPSTRLLASKVISATPEVAQRLALAAGEPVIHIVRLRLADEQPVVHETRYLARSLCPALLNDDLEAESVHSLLIHKYRIPLIRTIHTIEAHILSPQEASLLQAEPGTAAFFVDRLTYTMDQTGERPAVWYRAIYRGDEYHFKAEFETPV